MKSPRNTPTDLGGMESALRRAAEDARRLTSGAAERMKALDEYRMRIDSVSVTFQVAFKPVLDLAAQLTKHQDLVRIARGPVADVPDVLSHVAGSALEALTRARAVIEEYDARFGTLPDHLEGSTTFTERIAAAARAFSVSESGIVQAVKSIRSPWLDTRNQEASIRAFADLQGLASVVTALPAFDDHASDALRRSLGDWRDVITFPHDIFDDVASRSDFYVGRGFDPALTDFPRPAFREALAAGGLDEEPVSEDDTCLPPKSGWSVEEEIRFRATSEAHDSLMRLEVRLRRFIDERMTHEFGPDWPERQLPNGVCDRWLKKKRRVEAGESGTWPLIAYADFTDYERVVCRKDNWRKVFRRCFGRPESVRESFQRLYPVRLAVMHARPITQDDELLLRAEVVRLTRVMPAS